AIEATDRDVVVAWPADDRDRVGRWRSGEGASSCAVTTQAVGHALVDTGHRVQRVVTRGGMALRTGSRGRTVVRRLTGTTVQIGQEGGGRRMAATAVARGRVGRVVLDGSVIPLSGHGSADQHAEELRALVTGLAGRGRRRYGRVAGGVERRCVDVRRAELEATGVHVAGRVTARAAAVEAADRDVVVTRPADDRDRVGRRWSGERSSPRTVTGETARHALVHAGHGVQRVVARGSMALRPRGRGGDVIGRLTRPTVEVAQEGGRRRMAAAAVTARRVTRVVL